ncbi:tetratricopeptide repeat protein [Dongia sp.]|uniref:tetratricopeptide repeat protein n=1 Tax=Dongia sp. TaxID=1977262 RepID=UPI0035B302A3
MRFRPRRFQIGAGLAAIFLAASFGLGVADETPASADPAPAEAEPAPLNPLLETCVAAQVPETAALACTTAIESRQLQGEALAGALFTRGMAQGRRGQLPAAINDFTAALTLTPDATDVLYARGSAHAAIQRHDLAIGDFSAILKIDPKDADSLYRRAWSYTMLGRDKEAIADLSAVIGEAGDDMDALMDRGGLNIRLGDFDAAIGDFSAILKLDPKAAAAFYNRGRARALQNDFAAAAKDFAAAQESRADNPYAALRRYLATARSGKAEETLLSETIGRYPPEQWPLPILATLAGDMRESDLLASADLADRNVTQRLTAEAHFYLGEAALAKKDMKAAKAHFEAAAKGDRTIPEVIDAGWRLKQQPE